MVIRITNFGGLVPKASARALPDDAAQTAQDLQADTREFRPLNADSTAVANTGINNPKTIHRLARKADGSFNTDMGSGWIVKAGEMSFVKAQINDDTTERTYATFDDGSAPPRVYDATDLVTGRLLGVPAPTIAPTATVNVVDEFTTDEKNQGIDAALLYIKANVAQDMQPVWVGADHPGVDTPGYVDRDNTINLDPYEAQQLRVFQLASSGGANTGGITDTFASQDASHYQWVLDPTLGGFYGVAGASPGWATAGRDLWLIPFHAYGLKYTFDTAAMTTTLATMAHIPPEDGVPLLSSDQVTAVMSMVTDLIAQYDAGAQPKINAIRAQVQSLVAMLGGGGSAQMKTALEAFYASAGTQATLDTAFSQFAEAVWNQALQVHNYVPFTDITGGGGGG